jgi:hypothetical protein
LEASTTSKENMAGLENLTPELKNAYNCFNMRLNRIVERINVQIDETNIRNLKEERTDLEKQEGEVDLKEEVEEVE